MCKTGGPRCEKSRLFTSDKRKFQRTAKYRNATKYEQEKMLSIMEKEWKNKNKSIVQEHAPKKLQFHTKARNKPLASVKKVSDEIGTYNEPTENYSIENLLEENRSLQEHVGDDVYHSLKNYSLLGSLRVNSLLRHDTSHKEYPKNDEDKDRTLEQVREMDSCFDKASEILPDSKTRELYREIPVPAGWTAHQFIKKYYTPGSVIADKGFISTTESPSHIVERVNNSQHKNAQSIVFKIHSTKGVSLQEEKPSYSSIQSREIERILPRETRMVVIGTSTQEYLEDDSISTNGTPMFSHRENKSSVKVHTIHLIDEDLFNESI